MQSSSAPSCSGVTSPSVASPSSSGPLRHHPQARTKPKVLCVDDEPLILAGLDYQLRETYRVVTASDGASALRALQKQPDICVVLSDLRMSRMDGLTFLSQVRTIAPRIVTMLITGGLRDAALKAAVSRFGVYRVLTKPCSAQELRDAIRAGVDVYRSRSVD